MYKLDVEIGGLPPTQNAQLKKGAFWNTQNQKKRWLKLIHLMTLTNRPKTPLKKAQIELTRFSSSMPDYDGLVASFKIVIDCLVKLNILEDDSMNHLPNPVYKWDRAHPRLGKIRIVLTELPCDNTPQGKSLGQT